MDAVGVRRTREVMVARYLPGVRPLFRLDDLVVTDVSVDLPEAPQRARLAVDGAGATWLVEDLRAAQLEDEVAWQLFVADALTRADSDTRVVTVAGAPVARTPLSPGIALDDLLDVVEEASGTAPPAATLALVGAFAAAVARRRHAPWVPVPILWLGVDGRLVALGSIRRDDHGVRRGRRCQWRYVRPESLRGATDVDEPGVVYIVGVVLHLLVHGCPPWGAPPRARASGAANAPSTGVEQLLAMSKQQRSVSTPPADPLAALARDCTAFVAAERPRLEDVLTTLRQLQGPSRVERAWLPLAAGLCPDTWQAACAARDELGVLSADGAGLPAFSSAPLDATPYREWLRAPPPDGIFWATRPAGPTPPALPG